VASGGICAKVSRGWGAWRAQHYCLSAVSSDARLLCSCAPYTHVVSITASLLSKDEAYALSSEGAWAPAKQQPAPVSVCVCNSV